MTVDEPAKVLAVIDILLRALGMRALAVMTLIMTFALFGYAIYKETILASLVAAAFGLSALLPVLYIGWKKGDP